MDTITRQITVRPFQASDVSELTTLYCGCFAEPPWYEVHAPNEVSAEVHRVAQAPDATLAVALSCGAVIGAAWSYDFERKPGETFGADVPFHAVYIAEIFVGRETRGLGAARSLVKYLLENTAHEYGVVRTSVNQPVIIKLFHELGWQIVARETVVSRKYKDGVLADIPDERVMMTGKVRYK